MGKCYLDALKENHLLSEGGAAIMIKSRNKQDGVKW